MPAEASVRPSPACTPDKLLLLIVDDDPRYGESVAGLELPPCLVWRVDRAAAEVLLKAYVPALIICANYVPSDAALERLSRCALPAGRPPVVVKSVPAWAIESVVRGFADQAARRPAGDNRKRFTA